jgi:regulator of sigma E protease
MWEIVVLLRNMVTSWIVGSSSPELGGPIAIAEASDEVAESGWIALLGFMAFISFQLAIFNILPFPALDGGRILFVAIEWVRRGKRISPEKEGLVHLVGFAVLISSIVVISYFDVVRIVQG